MGKPYKGKGSKDPKQTGAQASKGDIFNRYPQLLKDAGQISYSNVLGTETLFNPHSEGFYLPGIMVLDYVPSIGVSADGNSDINAATRLLYSWIRHANSGSRNYEGADLMMYVVSMSSAYTVLFTLRRIYGLMTTFSPMNRYIAKGLVQALGFDFDTIAANLASFRTYINYLTTRLASLAVPKEFKLYEHQAILCSNVYKDAGHDKAQLYAFNPSMLFKFSGFSSETGTQLQVVGTPWFNPNNYLMKYADIPTWCENFLKELFINEDVGIMSGDILKAFGENGIHKLDLIPETYAVVPVFDADMLHRIHNADIGYELVKSASNIIQQNGNIKWTPKFYVPVDTNEISVEECTKLHECYEVFDCPSDEPTPQYNMSISRFKHVTGEAAALDSHHYSLEVVSCGTELITKATIWRLNSAGTLLIETNPRGIYWNSGTSADWSYTGKQAITISYFDYAPLRMVVDRGTAMLARPTGELFNYAVCDPSVVKKLHTVAVLSLIDIPSIAMGNRG